MKHLKKILLMGKLFDLNLNDAKEFEKSVNDELNQVFAKTKISDPFIAKMNGDTLTMKLGLITEDSNDPNVYLNPDSDSIPYEIIRLLEGDQKKSLFPFSTPFGDHFRFLMGIDDFITEFKRSSRKNHASRIKAIDVKYSRVRGLTMNLTF